MDFLKMKCYFLIFNRIIIRHISNFKMEKLYTFNYFMMNIQQHILREEQFASLIITWYDSRRQRRWNN